MTQAGSPAVNLDWPLMHNNITREDMDAVVRFLSDGEPILTQSRQVQAFEREWSEWLGTKYSVLVNSGSSANLITLAALREAVGLGEVIVPPLTWVSDIAAVLQNGFTPVFVDIDRRTLGMQPCQILEKISPRTKAVFVTHVLGYNALTPELVAELASRKVALIEDVCESHGATMQGKRLGGFGLMSNFSFYYAHHLSTIEGGMVCTDDRGLYETLRMFRSHGMVRECSSQEARAPYYRQYPDLNPDFIFAFPAYNVRSTEINAVIGRSQLKRLDANNQAPAAKPRPFPGPSRRGQVPDRLCDRRELQLRVHAHSAGVGRCLARPSGCHHAVLWGRVPAGHLRRRKSASPTVPEETAGRRGIPQVSPGGPRSLLWFLPRELSRPGDGEDPRLVQDHQSLKYEPD